MASRSQGRSKQLQDAGHIELIASSATHGYSPLLSQDTSIQAQVKQGVQTYRRHYGADPRGYWLPECAYRPRYSWAYPVAPDGDEHHPYLRKGVEEFLGENGLRYFMVESHLFRGAYSGASSDTCGGTEEDETIRGVYADRFPALKRLWLDFTRQAPASQFDRSIYQAHYIAGRGEAADPVAVFARDPKTGYQVWSSNTGYPGDKWYLEFHKKHVPGGLKYHRVTGPGIGLGDKLPYEPDQAQEMVRSHAEHFVGLVRDVLRQESANIGRGRSDLLAFRYRAFRTLVV